MFRRLIVAVLVLFLLAACGGSGPVDLSGKWTTVNSSDPAFEMSAVVADNVMEIMWVHEDTRALYWKGSAPDIINSGEIFVSEGDTKAMDASLLGSLDSTKPFTYEDNQLRFDLTVMGITQTIKMERTK